MIRNTLLIVRRAVVCHSSWIRQSRTDISGIHGYCKKVVISSAFRQSSSLADDKERGVEIRNHLSTLNDTEQREHAEAELAKFSDVEKRRLRVLEMEYDTWQSTGCRVPDEMTNLYWYIIFHIPSAGARLKMYSHWFRLEKKKISEQVKKEKRQKNHVERLARKREELEQVAREQGLPEGTLPVKETMHLFVREATMKMHYYNNLAWSMRYGQPLVFDLSLEQHMKDRERGSLVKQLVYCHGVNRVRQEPFHMCFTGLLQDGFISRGLTKSEQSFVNSAPVTCTSQHYLDIYPRDRLVYLTPDSKTELTKWNPNDIYIVGGLVDLAADKPVTHAKAKREGIRSARLPLDKYLLWKMGSKSLTLDVLLKVLCEVKDTGDWVTALKNLPSRKCGIRPEYTPEYQQMVKDHKEQKRMKVYKRVKNY